MSITTKILDSEKSYSDFRNSLQLFEFIDLELLLDWYRMYDDQVFEWQIKAIHDEIEFRKSKLGKELF